MTVSVTDRTTGKDFVTVLIISTCGVPECSMSVSFDGPFHVSKISKRLEEIKKGNHNESKEVVLVDSGTRPCEIACYVE